LRLSYAHILRDDLITDSVSYDLTHG